ncbi:GNAT family N-acetyltransferase [Escherichia coli]|uniref:GNAT family N-acetyltransferase n=1 Tax=Buttiauxella gaviniae TaxID=82990 RepID=UPI001DECE100|nr:GNAT family N-acetyltransferase [Escherichia coli]
MVNDLTERLTAEHDISDFYSGEEMLDTWLRTRALKNDSTGATRTFVLCAEGTRRVIGYYSLSTGSIQREDVTGAFRRNMPEPIPVIIIARLAVDLVHQHQRFGGKLLREAVLRVLLVSKTVGVRGVIVHALTDDAKAFYKRFGFIESPTQSHTLMLSLKDAG